MDTDKKPYIVQQDTEDALYTRLQRRTQEEAQLLSGKVWTDYNAHDPGVTLAEAANYALTELDYKLGFSLADYLSEADRPFDAARFGLFPPADVYTTSPVTEDDYRRMLLANIPGLENADVSCNPETGSYAVRIQPSPFEEGSGSELIGQVKTFFHGHRNLCEMLEAVEVIHPDTLEFEAEAEIEPGADATEVLARLYACILRYLSGRTEGKTTEHGLYRELRRVEGISRFRTCYLTKDGVPRTRLDGFSLRIPKEDKDFGKTRMRCGRMTCRIVPDRFIERLKGICLTERAERGWKRLDNETYTSRPTGVWRDVYAHYPIASDLPGCYRLTPNEKLPSAFEAYTRLYDWVIRNGLAELESLPRLLSLDKEDEGALQTRNQLKLKSRYLDFLDALYGVESHPAWLSEEDSYGETLGGTVRRRTTFLRNIARLERDRSKARNLYADDGDTPTIKEYFCLLLGLDPDDGHTVSNVLPTHNLRLLDRRKDGGKFPGITDRIDSLLIGERMMRPENVQAVGLQILAKDEEGKRREYAEMRAVLPFFNENRITGDLFRGGTRLDSYKIVRTDGDMYMLIYRHQEYGDWTNLGQDTDPKALERLANILRRFLRELNRKSETLYVVEPVLVDRGRAFEVVLVLPSWTFRFHSPRFRSKCRNLLRGIVPAHLTGKVCWLGEKGMRSFELCYHHLMHTFTDERLTGYRGDLLRAIDELTAQADEIQDLDDTD